MSDTNAVTGDVPGSSPARDPISSPAILAPAPEKTATTGPGPRQSQVSHVFGLIHDGIRSGTQAPEDICTMLAFWALSTWFSDVLPVVPSLVISGPAHHGLQLLRVLEPFCATPCLLAGFRKSDYSKLRAWTLLLSEPNLSRDMAAFLGSMSCRGFETMDCGYLTRRYRSIAVYIGERSPVGLIPYSISIAIRPSETLSAAPLELWSRAQAVRDQISHYRKKHSARVSQGTFNPAGLSSEVTEIARSLGSCIVDDAGLQNKLIDVLRHDDRGRLSSRGDTTEAIVIEATRSLSRKQLQHIYVREIVAEANRLLELRGEAIRLSPEKVGHRLRRLGLPSRRLNQSGNGLVLDRATMDSVEQLAAMYVEEDCVKAVEVSSSLEAAEGKGIKQVM